MGLFLAAARPHLGQPPHLVAALAEGPRRGDEILARGVKLSLGREELGLVHPERRLAIGRGRRRPIRLLRGRKQVRAQRDAACLGLLEPVGHEVDLGAAAGDALRRLRFLIPAAFEAPLEEVEAAIEGMEGVAGGLMARLVLHERLPGGLKRRIGPAQARRRRGLFLLQLVAPGPLKTGRLPKLATFVMEQEALGPVDRSAEARVASRARRLPLQSVDLSLDLADQVVDTEKVGLRRLELRLRLPLADLVECDPCGLLDEHPSFARPRGEHRVHPSLLDDGVHAAADTDLGQELLDVPQATLLTVDEVLTLARAEQPPRDEDLPRAGHREAVGVALMTIAAAAAVSVPFAALGHFRPGQVEGDLRHTEGLPGLAAVEDDVAHLLGAEAARALLADDPAEGVRNVALAAAVRAHDGGDAGAEGELRRR